MNSTYEPKPFKKKGQTPEGVCPFYSRPFGSELVHNRALLLSDWCLNRV